MGDFTAFESVSFTVHLAFLCPAASIGFGLGHIVTMTSSSTNKRLVADDGTAGFQLPLWPNFKTDRLLDDLNLGRVAQRANISYKNMTVAQAEYAQAAI